MEKQSIVWAQGQGGWRKNGEDGGLTGEDGGQNRCGMRADEGGDMC